MDLKVRQTIYGLFLNASFYEHFTRNTTEVSTPIGFFLKESDALEAQQKHLKDHPEEDTTVEGVEVY